MYTLPPLPYAFDALEPYIDKETMQIHYEKHHQAYIDNLNKALKDYPALQQKTLVQLLENIQDIPEEVRTAIVNNGGGTYNHSMFWLLMKKNGGGVPRNSIGTKIKETFGNFEEFQNQFNSAAKSVFGSGWAWLVGDEQGSLHIISTPNQNNPLSKGHVPLIGLDVWEHAYYLKYQNRRPDYINAWWHVINWDQVEENYSLYKS